MQFDLTDEERMIQEMAAKFALRELRPQAAESFWMRSRLSLSMRSFCRSSDSRVPRRGEWKTTRCRRAWRAAGRRTGAVERTAAWLEERAGTMARITSNQGARMDLAGPPKTYPGANPWPVWAVLYQKSPGSAKKTAMAALSWQHQSRVREARTGHVQRSQQHVTVVILACIMPGPESRLYEPVKTGPKPVLPPA